MLTSGQRAVVTGASSGIGRSVAIALARRGLHVVMVGRDFAKLQKTTQEAGGATCPLEADLATEQGRRAVADQVGPSLDVLVHCAGAYVRSEAEHLSLEQWLLLETINLHAPVLPTAACLPALRAARGQVVFMNSSAAFSAAPGLGAYAASKRGLQAAAEALRHEVNGYGVRVLSIYPGRTDTPMQQAILASEKRTAEPNTLMRPGDVATMVLAALALPQTCEVTDIMMRPMRKL